MDGSKPQNEFTEEEILTEFKIKATRTMKTEERKKLTLEEQLHEAMQSPALKWRSDKPGRSHYPFNWRDKVPLKVKMATTVTPDIPQIMHTKKDTIALLDNEYYVWVNSYGAVSAILENGEHLGLLPSEFEVTGWHETK